MGPQKVQKYPLHMLPSPRSILPVASIQGLMTTREAAREAKTEDLQSLGSRLIDHSQKITVAARARTMAEKKAVGHRS